MRVAIIENMAGTPHGQLGVALAEANAEVHVIRAYAGNRFRKMRAVMMPLSFWAESRTHSTMPSIPIFQSLRV